MLTRNDRGAVSLDASRLEEIGDLLDVGVFTVDSNMVIRGWNRWLHTASGRHAEDVLGLPLRSIAPELSSVAESALRGACSGATSVLSHRLHKCLIRLPAPSGFESFEFMQQSARIVPHLTPDGTPVGAVALIEDVTERVAGEDELRAALQQAERANKAKAEFLAAMSHELRTPIGSIMGYSDLLQQGLFGPIAKEHEEPLERIKTVSGHLLGIVQEILTFSRVEAGREGIHIASTDATALLRNAVHAVEPLIRKKGLTLEASMPDAPIPMRSDPVKVGQVLINLLGNAIKFTESGFIRVSVARGDGETVRFVVQDSGEGIPPELQERIFEPFVQVETSFARRRDGTGLGLAVSRQLARLLKGDISVQSTAGHGASFTVTLPTVVEE